MREGLDLSRRARHTAPRNLQLAGGLESRLNAEQAFLHSLVTLPALVKVKHSFL